MTWKKLRGNTRQKFAPPLNSSDARKLAPSIKERFPVITGPMGWAKKHNQ